MSSVRLPSIFVIASSFECWIVRYAVVPVESNIKRPAAPAPDVLETRVANEFPASAQEILCQGVRRLVEYQDATYATTYLDRLAALRAAEQVAGGDGVLTREVGRHLALRMSYEDVIRVAQLKCSADRYRRIRDEVRAKPNEPVAVLDYFKPGIDELCAILPPGLARLLLNLFDRCGWHDRAHLGMKLRSTTITGFLRLRLLAGLRRWRPRSYGYATAQQDIAAWLGDIKSACDRDLNLALEIAECARLVKGYGETLKHGAENFARIRTAIIVPALSGAIDAARATDALANARVAALADPDGDRLVNLLREIDEDEQNPFAKTADLAVGRR